MKRHDIKYPWNRSIPLYYKPAFFAGYEQVISKGEDGEKYSWRYNIAPCIAIWTQHPAEIGYDRSRAYVFDPRATPEYTSKINEVKIDDHTHDGGYTTIGPRFPHAYGAGGIYLTYEEVCKIPDPRKDDDGHLIYETDQMAMVSRAFRQVYEGLFTAYHVRHHGFFGMLLHDAWHAQLWLVWHPGSWLGEQGEYPIATGQHWRAPRKLWISRARILPRKQMPKSSDGQCICPARRIFLEQVYATYMADLDVPKQPTGALEGAMMMAPAVSALSFTNNDMSARRFDQPDMENFVKDGKPASEIPKNLRSSNKPRVSLCVMSTYLPGEMSRIRSNIDENKLVLLNEGDTLVEALSRYVRKLKADAGSSQRFTDLDIIGHARSRDGILKVGELAITSSVAKQQFSELAERGIFASLGIERIRLLGCRTSQPRGQRVVRIIREYTGLEVYASRTDLFAVYFDKDGLRPEAEALLADDDVITNAGPGDLPPRDDYPAPAPDDDDDNYDDEPVAPEIAGPDRFSIDALSQINAAAVSAKYYQFWNPGSERFEALTRMLYTENPVRDNPLERANLEVLMPISVELRSERDFRSFDLFVDCERPRLRVNRKGASFAFRFRPAPPERSLRGMLEALGICFGLSHPCQCGAAES